MRFIKNISWWKGIMIIAAIFFALFAFSFLNRGGISGSDVVVSIQGPDIFKAQESVEFEIKLENKSRIELHNAAIFVVLSEFLSFENLDNAEQSAGRHSAEQGIGSYSAEQGIGLYSAEQKIDLGIVSPHSEVSQKITLFSKETEIEGAIKVRAEYSPKNLEGRFEATSEKEVSVSSLPLTVIFDIPQKAVNGQRIRAAFHFVADKEMEKLPLFAKLVLPGSFTLEDTEPVPFEDVIWRFEKIEQGVTYQVEFEGIIKGSENEDKKFELFFGDIKEDGSFGAQYSVFKTVNISSSPLEFSQKINGAEDYIASPGEELNFLIDYANKSGVDIDDITITVQLTGDVFDFEKLNTGVGYFNKNTRIIIWNKNFLQKFATLSKGDMGEINFSIPLKKDIVPKNYKDKNIYGVSRAVIETSSVPLALKGLSLRAEDESKIRLRTSLNLFTRAYYYEGPFSNSGSIPPKVGEKTTYTILWQVTNTLNDISGTRIEAPLPGHIVFEGEVYPPKDNFKYNETTHSVSWNMGALSSAIGSIFPVETIAFQVSVVPDENMRGQTFELIEQSKISGTDTFTEEFLEDFAPPVNSSLPDDIGIRDGDGVVW